MVSTKPSNNSGSNNNTNNRILLVDDEADITTVNTLGLQDNGFKVDAFNDPIQALSDFKNGAYDLALLDYRMPKMNGLELYLKIRKVDDKVKICFITAFDISTGNLKKDSQSNSNKTDQDKEEEEDVKCIIQKPIDIDNLVKRIKEELNS